VGANPALVAVDETAGRVLVVHGWGGPGSDDQDTTSGGTDILDARSGTVLATVAAGAVAPGSLWLAAHPQLIAVDERLGRAFVMDRAVGPRVVAPTAARVSIIDDRKAQVLGSLPAGPFPVALAIDPAAARLFVVNNYADCRSGLQEGVWARMPASLRRWLPFLGQPSPGQARLSCAAHGSVTVFDLTRA
jgi:DNA-binding beta-propeller fold protein YncE